MRPGRLGALALLTSASVGDSSFDCSSDDGTKFIATLKFITGVCCTQAGESCVDSSPTSCGSPSCRGAMSQVGPRCLEWLAGPKGSPFSGFRNQLQTSVDTCSHTPAPPNTVLLTGSTSNLTDACGTRVVDGRAEGTATWQDTLLVSAPDGMLPEIVIESLWLPPDDVLKVQDGNDRFAPVLRVFQGTDAEPDPKHNTPTIASGQQLFISLYSNAENEGKAVSLSLRIQCWCTTDAACGAHSSCGPDKRCAMLPEPEPEPELDACTSAPCRNHGTCTVQEPEPEPDPGASCSTATMQEGIADVSRECCGVDDATCVGGRPTSCDVGCAGAFLPFWHE
jgi:hypothetical protein